MFHAVEHARQAGHGVLYIDHNIGHVYSIVDRVVVLERGRVIRTVKKENTTIGELARAIGGPGLEEERADGEGSQ